MNALITHLYHNATLGFLDDVNDEYSAVDADVYIDGNMGGDIEALYAEYADACHAILWFHDDEIETLHDKRRVLCAAIHKVAEGAEDQGPDFWKANDPTL